MIENNAHTTTSELPTYLNTRFEFNNNKNLYHLLNANPSSVEDLNSDGKKVLGSLFPQAHDPILLANQDGGIIPASAPASPQADSISELLKQAAATAYCRPALRALGSGLPADDTILMKALNQAADRRDAKAFTHLYLAAQYAERRVAAKVLEMGAALLPDTMMVLRTAPRLEGDVAHSIAVAVRSGGMSHSSVSIALVTGWHYYIRCDVAVPPDFLALTRKFCREAVRMDLRYIRFQLETIALLSGDSVVANILNFGAGDDDASRCILEPARKNDTGAGWDESIPRRPEESTLGGGATLKRAIPKAGRNDPCPCGSGKKFKQCCAGVISTGDQYEVDGVTISAATSHPELILTLQQIRKMRSHELYVLDPKLLSYGLAEEMAIRLTLFREFSRAIEVMKAIGREEFSVKSIALIAYHFSEAREVEALRWILDWAPGTVNVSFEMEVLLAAPEERIHLLRQRASYAFEAERTGDPVSAQLLFSDLGFAAIRTDPAIGIVIARGVLPVCNRANQSMLIRDIENARDILGLDDNEPGYDIVDATTKASLDEARHAIDIEKVRTETASQVAKSDAEVRLLTAQIDSLQATLKEQVDADERARNLPQKKSTARAAATVPPESADTRELRDQLRRLKDNLKTEHEEHNRAKRNLQSAEEEIRRLTRAKPENPAPVQPADRNQDADESLSDAVKRQRQPLRIPEYGPAFRESLRQLPRQASDAAIRMTGRLATGDPSAWNTVKQLRQRPGTLSARVAGHYRLLFSIGPRDTLLLVDFIHRRDLDRWLD